MKLRLTFFFLLLLPLTSLAQSEASSRADSLEKVILELNAEVESINLKLDKTQKKFKSGIITATLGYAIVIAGGQMLGRENDELGQALLYVGGATGVVGTVLLIDSFRPLKRNPDKKKKTR
jgi:hypothetical protein